jgi:hypothetical protein
MSIVQRKEKRPFFGSDWIKRSLSRQRPLTQSVVVHGLHKSATMFLFEFFQTVAADRGVPFYSANLPDAGLPPNDGTPFCLSPLRSFEFENAQMPNESVGSTKRIFHIRDPRDILVSEYYSFGWIHPDEKGQMLSRRRTEIQEMSVDDYVLQQPEFSSWPLNEKFEPLLKLDLQSPDFALVRYEDMVLNFPVWVKAVVEPFDFSAPDRTVNRYVKKFAHQFEAKSESMTHRRKVTPGDHKEKLQPETIERLNERFHEVLSRFGYLG